MMADGTVDMKFTGSAQDLERAIDRLEKKYEALTGQIKAGQRAARAGGGVVADMQKWLASLVSIAAAYQLITAGVKSALDFQRELIRLQDEAGRKQDARTRTFAANAGINRQQAIVAEKKMQAVSRKLGVEPQLVQEAASQLIGSGASLEEAPGAAAEELLKGRAVTGGGDAGDLGRNASMYLNAKGLPVTAANIKKLMATVQGSRAAGNLEATSLQFLSRQASASSRPMEEDLALQNLLQDVTTEEPAATAFGAFMRLGDAPKDKVKKFMAKHGLLNANGHFIAQGKSFGEQLEALGAVSDKLPEEDKGEFFKGIGGSGQDATTIRAAVQNRNDPQKGWKAKLAAAKDIKRYDSVVADFFSGLDFASKVVELEQEQFNAANVAPDTARINARDLARKKAGMSPYVSSWIKAAGETAQQGGAQGETVSVIESFFGGLTFTGGAKANAQGTKTVNDRLADATEKNNALIEQQNALLEKMQPQPAKRPVAVKPDE